MKKHRLHSSLVKGIQLLGLSAREIEEAFQISQSQAKRLLRGDPVYLHQEQIDIVRSVIKNQLPYALPARIDRLLNNEKTRKAFVAWVHSAALMLDIYAKLQFYEDQSDFINVMDPFLVGLYTIDTGMRETRELLVQIHQKCPQYDALFFRGTRFLEEVKKIDTPSCRDRIPSSIDILALSPSDARIRETLRSNNEHY